MYIKVIVVAGAKREKLIKNSADHFEVFVKEKAEKNMANKRVIELLALYFKLPKGKIRIVNGHRHPHKLLVVEEEK
jgi:uncharacterized protein YggU (UPF0235/DUF167 family)